MLRLRRSGLQRSRPTETIETGRIYFDLVILIGLPLQKAYLLLHCLQLGLNTLSGRAQLPIETGCKSAFLTVVHIILRHSLHILPLWLLRCVHRTLIFMSHGTTVLFCKLHKSLAYFAILR